MAKGGGNNAADDVIGWIKGKNRSAVKVGNSGVDEPAKSLTFGV